MKIVESGLTIQEFFFNIIIIFFRNDLIFIKIINQRGWEEKSYECEPPWLFFFWSQLHFAHSKANLFNDGEHNS